MDTLSFSGGKRVTTLPTLAFNCCSSVSSTTSQNGTSLKRYSVCTSKFFSGLGNSKKNNRAPHLMVALGEFPHPQISPHLNRLLFFIFHRLFIICYISLLQQLITVFPLWFAWQSLDRPMDASSAHMQLSRKHWFGTTALNCLLVFFSPWIQINWFDHCLIISPPRRQSILLLFQAMSATSWMLIP